MDDALRSRLLDGIPHGFSTRNGLVGEDVLPGAIMVRARQVHSPDVVMVHGAYAEPPQCDAMVTATRGLLLCIVTADCAPVLMVDPEAGVVAAAHAGWRGALGGVLENTIAAMKALGAQEPRIRAAIGPTIAQASYEVDHRFRDEFDDGDARFFAFGRSGHRQFDLPAYVASRIAAAGVHQIDDLGCDTYADETRFYSYRRATHRGEPTGGRQVSAIGLARASAR